MSEFLQVAFTVIAPIFISASLGFWFGRRFSPDPQTLSRLAVYIFLPALVFQGMANSQMQPGEIGRIMLLVFSILTLVSVIASLLARVIPALSGETRSAFVVSAMMANAGNYGLPFISFAFIEPGPQVAIIVFITSSIFNYTLGIYVASSGKASVAQGISNVLRVPLPYAALLGLAVNLSGVTLPPVAERAVGLMAQAAVPLMLLLLGIQLSRFDVRSYLRRIIGPISMSAALRLFLPSLLCLLLAPVLGVSGLPRDVVLVQLSMPTAVSAALLATEFGSDVQFVSATILISTVASILSLSLLMTLLVV